VVRGGVGYAVGELIQVTALSRVLSDRFRKQFCFQFSWERHALENSYVFSSLGSETLWKTVFSVFLESSRLNDVMKEQFAFAQLTAC